MVKCGEWDKNVVFTRSRTAQKVYLFNPPPASLWFKSFRPARPGINTPHRFRYNEYGPAVKRGLELVRITAAQLIFFSPGWNHRETDCLPVVEYNSRRVMASEKSDCFSKIR